MLPEPGEEETSKVLLEHQDAIERSCNALADEMNLAFDRPLPDTTLTADSASYVNALCNEVCDRLVGNSTTFFNTPSQHAELLCKAEAELERERAELARSLSCFDEPFPTPELDSVVYEPSALIVDIPEESFALLSGISPELEACLGPADRQDEGDASNAYPPSSSPYQA
ncbi:hypothetical protein LTS18_013530 [Coniosporium uncinatum]|uniref:Uncharacterized protein n=1 Tax=Coniosporium uncinatum TaxID=93489 RepID=A0ACC3D8T0_9PEZI|nr:hypothetical protein LTS18_013530 [Coniosporium uncinatum]